MVLDLHGRTENARTDPTVWCFSAEGLGTRYAVVAAYVGGFIITGILVQKFEQLENVLRERFRWGSWKVQSFGLCGVRVHRKVDHTIVLHQTSNSGINPANLGAHTPRLVSTPDVWPNHESPRRVESSAVESDTGRTTAGGSVERDALGDMTTNAQIDRKTNKFVSDVKRNDTHPSFLPTVDV